MVEFKKRYKVRTHTSEHHFHVMVDKFDISAMGEREAVGHAAWIRLWENVKDKWGYDTGIPSPNARILRNLCNQMGVETVKRRFINSIVFTDETED